eukprot:jgi/Orpsp1_1/1192660/evm.model.d7180000095049.1
MEKSVEKKETGILKLTDDIIKTEIPKYLELRDYINFILSCKRLYECNKGSDIWNRELKNFQKKKEDIFDIISNNKDFPTSYLKYKEIKTVIRDYDQCFVRDERDWIKNNNELYSDGIYKIDIKGEFNNVSNGIYTPEFKVKFSRNSSGLDRLSFKINVIERFEENSQNKEKKIYSVKNEFDDMKFATYRNDEWCIIKCPEININHSYINPGSRIKVEFKIKDVNDNIMKTGISFKGVHLVKDNGKDENEYDASLYILHACEYADKTIVDRLISKKADVNIKNKNNDTPLLLACRKGNESVVKSLIESGADVNSKNSSNETPLIIGCINKYESIVKLLIDHGAEVNVKYKYSETPLIIALKNESEAIIKYLIDKGANVNVKNLNCVTPLIIACWKKNLSIIEYLIEHGADVNLKNIETPLIIVCRSGNEAIVKCLVEHGADVNTKNMNGETPITAALSSNNSYIKEYLIEKGAKEEQ